MANDASGADQNTTWYRSVHFPRRNRRSRKTTTRRLNTTNITKGGRYVGISTSANVHSHNAGDNTCVKRVGVWNPHTNVRVVVETTPILSAKGWIDAGLNSHPDKDFVNNIIHDSQYGVNVNYDGPRVPREFNNWQSVNKYSDAVCMSLQKDVSLGRKAGPFPYPPFSNLIVSPMGAFPKKRSLNKYRLIHDLSWPPGGSVNDFIHDCSVKYISVNDVTNTVKQYGSGTFMARIDISDAYKHILVRPEDWDLLGTKYINKAGNAEYYVDMTLPFGLRSSAKIFTRFAEALRFVMKHNGVSHVEQYLDDYITCAPTRKQCRINLNIMLKMCEIVGFVVNPDKIIEPATTIEFLGIIIDSIKMETRISQDRLRDIIQELSEFVGRQWCTKRQLLSLIGKLEFINRVVKPGRSFTRRMIDMSKHVKFLHHRIRLKRHFHEEVKWWLYFLPSWNGISTILID